MNNQHSPSQARKGQEIDKAENKAKRVGMHSMNNLERSKISQVTGWIL